MTRDEAIAVLRGLNPRARSGDLEIYVDAWNDYRIAQNNVEEHGSIVLHPRTGAPVKNPYLDVRAAAVRIMRKCRLNDDPLWVSAPRGLEARREGRGG